MTQIEEELYLALLAALDHLEGEVRLIALAAIERAEREDATVEIA
jgi:hypothetical protein